MSYYHHHLQPTEKIHVGGAWSSEVLLGLRGSARSESFYKYLCGGFPKLGVPFWGPYTKDYSLWGSMLRCTSFGKLPYNHSI